MWMYYLAGADKDASQFLADLDDNLFPGQPDKDFVDTVKWSPSWERSSRDEMVTYFPRFSYNHI
jgi:hypothetical protein